MSIQYNLKVIISKYSEQLKSCELRDFNENCQHQKQFENRDMGSTIADFYLNFSNSKL